MDLCLWCHGGAFFNRTFALRFAYIDFLAIVHDTFAQLFQVFVFLILFRVKIWLTLYILGSLALGSSNSQPSHLVLNLLLALLTMPIHGSRACHDQIRHWISHVVRKRGWVFRRS